MNTHDKSEATRLADALRRCADIDFDGDFAAAAALLDRWPDGEPFCYLRQTSTERNPPHGWAVHYSRQLGDVPLYTAPLAKSERIAALEREVGALRKLYEVVIAHNRAGAAWGEQFGDLMAALGGIHAIDAARSKT